MSNVSIFIGSPQADSPEAQLLLDLAEELDIDWTREVVIDGADADDLMLHRKMTATIDIPTDSQNRNTV